MRGAKPCVLVVDDDVAVRDSLCNVLEQAGYTVVVAADGRDGLAELKHQQMDVLLLDLNLPKLNGFELLDVAVEKCPLAGVIILTGMLAHCEPGALAGADALFEKPPDVAKLLQTIAQLVAQPAEERLKRRLGNSPGALPTPGGYAWRVTSVPVASSSGTPPGATSLR